MREDGLPRRHSGPIGPTRCKIQILRILLLALLVTALIPGAAVTTARADCSDYVNSMHWVSGQSFWSYVPGYYPYGTLDLVQTGNKVLALDDVVGLAAYEEVAPGELELRGSLSMEDLRALDAAGDRAYVARGGHGLTVVRTDLGSMTELQTVPLPSAETVDVEGGYAYVGGYAELAIVRLTEPGVAVVGRLQGTALRVAVRGSYAYVIGDQALKVADVSDPTAPVYVGTPYQGNLLDCAVAGNYLYVTAYGVGLLVFDLAVPDQPALLATALIPQPPFSLALGPDRALVGFTDGFAYVDLQDPAAPVVRGIYRGFTLSGGVINGDFAYLAAGMQGVQVMALGAGTMPDPVASIYGITSGVDLHVEGNLLTVLSSHSVKTIDVSSPAEPVWIGSLSLPSAISMAVQGDKAYVVGGSSFRVVDLSTPASPALMATMNDVAAGFVVASGDRVYALDWGWNMANLWIIDVSDPGAPSLLAHTQIGLAVDAAAIQGTTLFTAMNFEGSGTIYKWDVSDPDNVQYVDERWFGRITDLAIGHGRLIATTQTTILSIDPDNLQSVQYLGAHSFGGEIGFGAQGRVYSVNNVGGFNLLSLESGSLEYVGSGATPAGGGDRVGIVEVSGYVYVTDYYRGLYVFAPACTPSGVAESRIPDSALRSSPNPFARETSLRFRLAEPSPAALRVFDVTGREVRVLLPDGVLGRGWHEAVWDGRDELGRVLPSGVFFARLSLPGQTITRRIERIR